MKLKKLKLYNYRCFGEETIVEAEDFIGIVGNNSSGKSAALSALNCLFSSNSSDRLLKRSDFHIPKNIKPEELDKQELYIEAVFSFDELKEDSCDLSAIPVFFKSFIVDQPGEIPYIRIRLEATWERSSNLEGAIDSSISYITCPESEQITDSDKTSISRKGLDSIRVIYVPAVRDPAQQLKNSSKSILLPLIKKINWNQKNVTSIKEQLENLNNLILEEEGISILGDSISSQWKLYDSDSRFSSAQLRFGNMKLEDYLKKPEIYFSPTVTERDYASDELSDGLRSLFYISLIDSLLKIEQEVRQETNGEIENNTFNYSPPALTIIAMEEPENHIAPHLLGKLIGNFRNIIQTGNAQIILTSHSPALIKRIPPESLRFFRMDPLTWSTIVKKLSLPDETSSQRYKFVNEAVNAYPELYFSKLVILGEGSSEEIILSKVWEAQYGDIDLNAISIVPLGGRHVNHFWRLLNDLNIPHLTLLDLDKERDGGGWGRIKYVINQLLLCGIDEKDLLNCPGDSISRAELDQMDSFDILDLNRMNLWLKHLRTYGVFFSFPLDIDFLMLENYGEYYKKILDEDEGPRLKFEKMDQSRTIKISELERNLSDLLGNQELCKAYQARVSSDISHTLKTNGGSGETYTKEQRQLMIWYNYFFLNRGKPSTHVEALANINQEKLLENIPEELGSLIKEAKKLLGLFNND